jgi:RimJ/RimL family protein N-acetyltransferase
MASTPSSSGAPRPPPLLVSPHVRLEALTVGHETDLYAAGQAPEIWTYLPTVHAPFQSREATRHWIDEALAQQATGWRWPFAIVWQATGRAIGSTSYLDLRWSDRALEIGWTWLTPAYWRTVVNTQCKYLLLQHAFEALGMYRVQLLTDSRNQRSQRAIERLGARKEGVLRSHILCPDGYRRDSVLYSILDHEWPEVRRRLEAARHRT